MSPQAETLPNLLCLPLRDRIATLLCAVTALENPAARDLVIAAADRWPHIARPQLMQQVILELMAYVNSQTGGSLTALYPVAEATRVGLEGHLDAPTMAPLRPYATALSGLLEALFPDLPVSSDPRLSA